MRIVLLAAAIAVAAGFELGAEAGARTDPPPARRGMAPARSGDVAIRQELEAARRAGTRAAYSLFIIRHGNHPLAHAARRERARLATPGRR
jgi:hypothetical protein